MTDSSATTPSSQRALPLERKLPLLILALFTLVLAISLAASYYEVRTSAMQLASERLTSLSRVLSSLVDQQTSTRIALMHRVAHDTAVQNALREPNKPMPLSAQRALSVLMVNRGDSMPPQLWTADGRPAGNIALELPAEEQQHLRDDIVRLGSSRDSALIGPLKPQGGRTVFWEAVPVHDNQGNRLLGYIVHERQLANNPRTVQPLRDLMGADIDFYFRNATDDTWVGLAGATAAAPLKAVPYRDGTVVYTHANRGDMLAATARVPGTPFLITVERGVDAILARPLAMMRVLIILALLLMVIGALVVWVLGRQLVRPLGDLTRAAEEMAAGRYTQRVEARSDDEVGRLASAFNRMAHEVQVASDASDAAVARLTRTADDQAFLAEASRILAGSLSDDTLLVNLARHCVPRMADYCTIHVAEDDGAIRRIETAHRDPAKRAVVLDLVRRYEHRVDGSSEVAQVIMTQQPMLLQHIDLDAAAAAGPDDDTRRLLRAVAPSSFLCVPLIARGRAFGAISFTIAGSQRVYTQEDLELATELARRTAVAIDNAVIYRRSLALRLEAEAASNAKSDFLAKMSHEIRTPINAMMGYAELLQMGIGGPITEAQAKQLGRIRASGEHLTSLVNEILDLAKIEAGRMAVKSSIGSAGDAAEAALNLIRPQATTKGVELTPRVDGDPDVEYFGDPQRVQQILTNLLSNAVKFTPAGGRISTSCSVGQRADGASHDHGKDWVRICVADTGVGVAAADLERIFQPFVQADAGYTRTHGGTGLGLTISRSLAQMMGGDITVESEPGKGSRFTLWLPCPDRAIAAT